MMIKISRKEIEKSGTVTWYINTLIIVDKSEIKTRETHSFVLLQQTHSVRCYRIMIAEIGEKA